MEGELYLQQLQYCSCNVGLWSCHSYAETKGMLYLWCQACVCVCACTCVRVTSPRAYSWTVNSGHHCINTQLHSVAQIWRYSDNQYWMANICRYQITDPIWELSAFQYIFSSFQHYVILTDSFLSKNLVGYRHTFCNIACKQWRYFWPVWWYPVTSWFFCADIICEAMCISKYGLLVLR